MNEDNRITHIMVALSIAHISSRVASKDADKPSAVD